MFTATGERDERFRTLADRLQVDRGEMRSGTRTGLSENAAHVVAHSLVVHAHRRGDLAIRVAGRNHFDNFTVGLVANPNRR